MKHLRRLFQLLACVLIGAYIALIFALDQTWVQHRIADAVEEQLEEVLQSDVEIGHINIGLFNAVELHDVTLYDRSHKEMLSSQLIYGKVSIAPLLQGKIHLRNISVLDASFCLYKKTADGETNFKYVLEAFKSKDKKKKPLDLVINSLILRRCQVAYDELYLPYPADNRFTQHHIFARNVDANVSLKRLTDDEINLRIRQLSLTEQSGFKIDKLRLHIIADKKHAEIHDLFIALPNSHITQEELAVDYDLKDDRRFVKTLRLSGHFKDVRIATSDIRAFVPALRNVDETIVADTELRLDNSLISMRNLMLRDTSDAFRMSGDVAVNTNAAGLLKVGATVRELSLQQNILSLIFTELLQKPIPTAVQALGEISFSGDAAYAHNKQLSGLAANSGSVKGLLTTALGLLDADVKLERRNLTASLASKDFNPSLLAAQNKFVPSFVNFSLNGSALLIPQTTGIGIGTTKADIMVNSVTIDNVHYSNIHAVANYDSNSHAVLQFSADDAAARLQAEVQAQLATETPWKERPDDIAFNVNIEHLSPSQLHLTNRYGQGVLSLKATGDISSLDLYDLYGNIRVSDFSLTGDNGNTMPYHLERFDINMQPTSNGNHITLRSDFADLDYSGPVHPAELKNVAKSIYDNVQKGVFNESKSASEISQGRQPQSFDPYDKKVNFIATLKDAEFLNRLCGINANYKGSIQAQGSASYDGKDLVLACRAPHLSFGKFNVADISLYVRSDDGSFNVLGKARKPLTNGDLKLELTAINRDGRIYTDIEWGENVHNAFYGKVSAISTIDAPSNESSASLAASTDFGIAKPQEAHKSKFGITTEFTPSEVCIGDSIWQFSKSSIDYHDNRIIIDNFGVHNNTQRLAINGKYTRSSNDTITVDLHNLDLDYVLAFARLDVVQFSGHATGKIYVKALPNGDPWARARVHVPDFEFNHAPFGIADVTLGWNHAERDILIDGHITEPGIGSTDVVGYVDPVNRNLDLDTKSVNTQLGFLNKYTDGIFSDISGRATGNCRIYGGFQTIEFSGHEVGEAEATIPVTGVTYRVTDADVDIIPDMFWIKSAKIFDMYNGEGTASGNLMHTHIKNMSYDFDLSGTNLRMYDKPREYDMPFYATATGTGRVHIEGRPGIMNADIRIATVPGSELTYIIDSPDADVSQLITFHNATATADTLTTLLPIVSTDKPTVAQNSTNSSAPATAVAAPVTTDFNLNFEVEVDDNSCLHLITDDKSGDVITVFGSGPIQANYHNKSGFTMYGTYNIDRGHYNLNIPSLAQRRNFEILSGGQVNFSGDPTNAEVNVKAQYAVNSASLADLNIGTGFANNTTRVNCLANIYGEVANMQFDLGFELPNCSQDEQQMVNNLIASDEDRTMQVLYLLGVGRFYAYNYTAPDIAQSQSVLMMNSLLSSTLSSQLNNIISDAMGSSNWTFGTNISTGQLGWSDMEVEGLVSSRLLNNRLLLNGNFGYSERQAATTNFVGDFDIQYLITPKGTVSIKAYSETNDRYFTKSTLTTQGIGIQLKKDFTKFINLFRRKKEQ